VGDEGKGKATDILGGRVDYVVKPNGGNNAGHTVVVGGEKYELKLLPAGVLSENATPVIGNGCVVNLEALFEEIDGLEARGANASRLKVSANAQLVAPYHQVLDKVTERFLGKRAIGTTGRGIGPTYADKVSRIGIRAQDLLDESILRQKVTGALNQKNQMLVKLYNRKAIDPEEIVQYFMGFAERLTPMLIDAELELNQALDAGKSVLMEGGQATMLDVDHGTYPFVTSSNPTAGGACVGSGIGPTRRSPAPWASSRPTPPVSAQARSPRNSSTSGASTCRPPVVRSGSTPDAPAAAAGTTPSSPGTRPGSTASPTSSSPSSTCSPASVRSRSAWPTTSTASLHDEMPMSQTDFHHATPVYETMPAWDEDISGCRTFDELPQKAKDYLNRLEELSGCRVSYVGVGPGRDETIVIHDVLD
jgi:adenylosuccinate synthase